MLFSAITMIRKKKVGEFELVLVVDPLLKMVKATTFDILWQSILVTSYVSESFTRFLMCKGEALYHAVYTNGRSNVVYSIWELVKCV